MNISWKIYVLPLASSFTISKGTFTHRRALILRLEQDGCTGYGEATEISYYGISIDHFIKVIRENISDLKKIELKSTEDYHFRISKIIGHLPFLVCAFDCAAHDLYGHLNKKPTRKILQLDTDQVLPPTSLTIGIAPVHQMIEKIKAKEWPIYKIKLGTKDDIGIITSLRNQTASVLRVDANGGWTSAETIRNSILLDELGVEFIEQPLPSDLDHQMTAVLEQSVLPLIADESCQTENDVTKCHLRFDGINIKLMKCGGLTVALRMIEEARSLGLKIMIGCMTESSIGISAAAQLIPLVDYVDLDGAMLIKEDIATGVSFIDGYPRFPESPGLGCQLFNEEGMSAL